MKRLLLPCKRVGWYVLLFVLNLCIHQALAQTNVSGIVTDAADRPLVGISIQVKGKVVGTTTNNEGRFTLHVGDRPPLILQISSIGFASQEVTVAEQSVTLSITLQEQSIMASEVVVSASRVEESVMKSPVSIEKLNILGIRQSPQPSFYDALRNLKGVEMSTQSLTFSSVNTRGFGSNGNTRLVQLVDGMDNQAPGLSFAVGNVVGMSELDVESVELLPGAASALYGPNAINGVLLMNSKSPFRYQGLSAYVKTGLMSASNRTQQNTAFYDVAVRFAKAFNDRFAFKANVSYLTAQDWQASDYRDQSYANGATLENNVGNVRGNAMYNGVNWYGVEGANLYDVLYGNGLPGDGTDGSSQALGALYSPINDAGITLPQLMAGENPVAQLAAAQSIFQNMVPQYYQHAPGYAERDLTDYPAQSLKLNASLHYRLTDDVEAIVQANWGRGTTVYTGLQRYNIENFSIGQYKAELRGDNFFVRGYTTHENSGDANALGALASRLSERYLVNAIGGGAPVFVQQAFTQYAGAFMQAYTTAIGGGADHQAALQVGQSTANAHAAANRDEWMRSAMAPALAASDALFLPGGSEFEAAKADIKGEPIPQGAQFVDRSKMYHAEAMYNFKRQLDPDIVELIAGANYRVYHLNSQGTLFARDDNGGEFSIREYGAYVQAARNFNDVFKLTASVRYDKNENFEGQFSPRVSGVLTVARDHNFRASFQRGFRIPTTQNQYIDLPTPDAHLIGGLPLFWERYNMDDNPVYAVDLRNGTTTQYAFKEWEPERVETYEVGYKALLDNRFFVDLFYYYNRFLTFEGNMMLIQHKQGQPVSWEDYVANRNDYTTYGMPMNAPETVKNSGWGVGLEYLVGRGYSLSGNVTQNVLLNDDELRERNPSFFTYFNSPKYRFNLGLSNRDIGGSGWGFGVTFRRQTEVVWQSALASTEINFRRETIIPAFSTFDAQVSKKISAIKSIVKLGGTNIGNRLYTTSWGNPSVGGLYYVSLLFDELLN